MLKLIDPHLHLFNLDLGQYRWLDSANPPHWPNKQRLKQDWRERDLTLAEQIELCGYVHIEAGFDNDRSWREVDWVGEQSKLPQRSIAHIDLRLPNTQFVQSLNQLKAYPSFVGIRHILDTPVQSVLDHPNCAANLQLLQQSGSMFELQFNAEDSSETRRIVDLVAEYCEMPFILNHAGLLTRNRGSDRFLRTERLGALASFRNLFVKCSGWEMNDSAFHASDAVDITRQLVDLFGEQRVMLASNFPVIKLWGGYQQYWTTLVEQMSLEKDPIEALMFSNAQRLYRF